MGIRGEIELYVKSNILPQYNAFDRGHNVSHAESVIATSAELATHYDVDVEMVYIIAAFHDVGLCHGRENHHITSGKILIDDGFIAERFTHTQRQTMRDAIEDHRASSTTQPRTIYGMIVAEADRQISPRKTLLRTIQYGLKQNPNCSMEWHYQRFVAHLTEKYAEGGYLKLYIPQSNNAKQLQILRQIISNRSQLQAIFEELYRNETQGSL